MQPEGEGISRILLTGGRQKWQSDGVSPSGCAHAAWWRLGTATGTGSPWCLGTGGLWFRSNKRTSRGWEAAELCQCIGEDGKNRLARLSAEGLCWSRAPAEDASPLAPTVDARAAVQQPWPRSERRSYLRCLRVMPCLATKQHWDETEKAFTWRCGFSWLKRARLEGGGYCCLPHLSSLWQFLSLAAILKVRSDVKWI